MVISQVGGVEDGAGGLQQASIQGGGGKGAQGNSDFAEKVSQLERVTGDLEDAVAAINSSAWTYKNRKVLTVSGMEVTGGFRHKLAAAVNFLQATEKAIGDVVDGKFECGDVVSKVDIRVDRAVAALKPAAVADYRSVLASIGWPPPLSSGGNSESGQGEKGGHNNPLLDMGPEASSKFEKSFLVLAGLQGVQVRRKARQLSQTSAAPQPSQHLKRRPSEPTWAIDELVGPIESRAEYHFVKWVKRPELVFSLIHRLTQQYVDVVEEILQPLLVRAKLTGCRAREDWISAMVKVGGNHLRTHALPDILADLQYETGPTAALWLHTVDETIAFDAKMQSLAARSIGLFPVQGKELTGIQEKALGLEVACISVFAERSEWLEIWARLEFGDALQKLRYVLDREESWEVRPRLHSSAFLEGAGYESISVSPLEEFGAPSGAEAMTTNMATVMDRCRTLLEADQRLTFVRLAAAPLSHEYLDYLQRRCREVEGLTSLADEDSMVKVAVCTNAARYCHSAVQDWGEDIFFLELRMAQLKQSGDIPTSSSLADVEGSVFDEELESFTKFQHDWINKLVLVTTRGFESTCRDYIRNKRRWQDEAETILDRAGGSSQELVDGLQSLQIDHATLGPSPSLVNALAELQSRLRALQHSFCQTNFLEYWRALAASLDQLLFFSVIAGAKFSEHGGLQLAADVQALFKIFKAFCARPGSYFKNLSDVSKLLTLAEGDAVALLQTMHASAWEIEDDAESVVKDEVEALLKKHGVRRLSCSVAFKILNNRVFLR